MNSRFTYIILLFFVISISLSCKIKSQLPDPLEAGWKGEQICELLFENKELRVLKCTFKPGYGHEKHFHKAHFGYALAGSKFRISDINGDREVNIPASYHFYNEGVEWHEVQNTGDSTAVFLIIEPK